MPTPSEIVTDAFAKANTYANAALTQLSGFTAKLTSNIYAAPTVNITWAPVAAPADIAPPVRPAALDLLEPEFTWDQDGSIAGSRPSAPVLVDPVITIDDFTEAAPDVVFPDAPTVTYGAIPAIPAVDAIVVPDAPVIADIAAPDLLALTMPTFAGVDLHTSLQTPLETMPTLALVAPTAFSFNPSAAYTDDLLVSLRTQLLARMNGGTGLPAAVEAAIWDRARDREVSVAQGNLDDAQHAAEAQGFQLPTGVLAAQVRRAQTALYDKVSGFSRDVAIKQADLEQLNLRETITAGLALESKLIDQALEIERIAFQTAVQVVTSNIALYNAQVEKFKAVVDSYRAYADAYRTIINAELAAIEVYKAEIAGEQAKAEINKALVERYKAQIEAGQARVKIYEAQVGAAGVLVSLEKTKIEAAGEQVRAYVAQINGETAKVEAYKAGVQAEGSKIEVYKAKAQAFGVKVQAQGEKARAQISVYEGRIRAYQTEWQAWSARVQGEGERFRALASKSTAVIDGFRAEVASFDAAQTAAIKRWEVQVKEYEAQATYTMNGQKLNAELIAANRASVLEAAKVGTQAYAQLTASAWNIIHTQADVGARSSESVSYQYSNDTETAPPSVTSI
jgi:hypothetical protein